MGWQRRGTLPPLSLRSTPIPRLPPGTTPLRTRNRIPPATTSTPKGPPGPNPNRDSHSTCTTSRCRRRTPTRWINGGWGTSPPPPQYQAAPREAPQDPPTPPHWPGAPRDEAESRKPRRSRSPPRTAHPPPALTLPTAPPRLTCSLAPLPLPKGHHDPSRPRSRRFRCPGRHHAHHRRPMSTSPSPHEQHRASRSPRRPYASSTPSPRHRRSRPP